MLVVAAALSASPLAHAAMYKCTAPDGTVAYQAKPCQGDVKDARAEARDARSAPAAPGGSTTTKTAEVRPTVQVALTAEQRAVADREETQRRDRCRNYRETIERQRALEAAGPEKVRQAAIREIATQERRLASDRC